MQIATLQNVKLHWREDGRPDGPPVVFANSLGTDLRIWDKVLGFLPQTLRFIRFDLRGHGLSDCPPEPYSMDDLVEDAAQLLDHLGVRDCLFIGLSIGGMIGQGLAATRPELLRALVLSNTAAKMGESAMWQKRIETIAAHGIAPIAPQILDRWFSQEFLNSAELPAWRHMLTRTPKEGYIGCCHAISGTDLSESTARLGLPLLAIGGSEDQACPSHVVKATSDLINRSKFAEIPGVGHVPCVEAPEAFAGLINEFMKEQPDV